MSRVWKPAETESGASCRYSPGALLWAESRTREGSAEERKPEAGGAEGGARERGAPERIGWGEACGFSGERWKGLLPESGHGKRSSAQSQGAAGYLMENRGLEEWNAAAGGRETAG